MAAATPGSKQEKVNKMTPAASKAKLGDTVAELVAQVNALTAAHNAAMAKLDGDAGVTLTTYASGNGVPATPIKTLEQR